DEAPIEIAEGAIEERIALAEHRDIAPAGGVAGDGRGGGIVDLRLGELAVAEGHADGDLRLAARQVRRHDLAREAVAGLRRRIGDDGHGLQNAQRLQGDQLGIAGTDTEAIDGAAHGFIAANCVTGMSGRQPVKGPTGSARLTAMRTRAPPDSPRSASSRASPSSVTALATRRPRGFRAAQHCSTRPGTVRPPPMKTASGGGRSASAAGASPSTICSCGTPSAIAL